MVIEINIIPGIKATTETIERDMITKGSNIFNVRVWDIELMSV